MTDIGIFSGGWPVASNGYRVVDGVIQSVDDHVRSISPARATVATVFARVESEEDVLTFSNEYGLLTQIAPAAWRVDYVLRESAAVRAALELLAHLGAADDDGLSAALSAVHSAATAFDVGNYRLAIPDYEDLRDCGRQLVAALINLNIDGAHLHVEATATGIVQRQRFGTLKTAIWLQVARLATTATVRRCVECGKPFEVRDERQRFCPPKGRGEDSRCAMKARQREKRQRDRRKKRG